MNGDGLVNLADQLLLTQCILGTRTPTPAQRTAGDLNRNGRLDAGDLVVLTRKVLGIISHNLRQQLHDTLAALRDGLLPEARAALARGRLYYVHHDHLGTPLALTDEAGTIVWTATYDPFGKATVNEDPDGDGNPVTLNVRFPGQYYDRETGLHYNYFRVLPRFHGRFKNG